jgi:hypothetical protein
VSVWLTETETWVHNKLEGTRGNHNMEIVGDLKVGEQREPVPSEDEESCC